MERDSHMPTVRVNLGPRSYSIRIGSRILAEFPGFVRESVPKLSRVVFVTDPHVVEHCTDLAASLRQAGFSTEQLLVEAGEETKSVEWLEWIWNQLAEMNSDRKTLVIAVGGGVIGDLAGFAAASYNRGLAFLQVPTTLLAMVDSSVGGKTGINLELGKNLVGAFHQPSGVWIDTVFLDTLPEREFLSGLAEVFKYGVILDPDFFAYLEANTEAIRSRQPAVIEYLIERSCRLKADVVEQDEREETGLRAILNYGHTFAHAFEAVAGYGEWLHGEAVAMGMVCASRLAERMGMIPETVTTRQVQLLEALKLPVRPDPEWHPDELLKAMYRDKKTVHGKLKFILPTRIGQVKLIDGIPEEAVRAVL
jgi:3-dehydroquinate synthase